MTERVKRRGTIAHDMLYEYHHVTFDKEDGTVDVPERAIGITVDYFGDYAVVQFLTPVEQ